MLCRAAVKIESSLRCARLCCAPARPGPPSLRDLSSTRLTGGSHSHLLICKVPKSIAADELMRHDAASDQQRQLAKRSLIDRTPPHLRHGSRQTAFSKHGRNSRWIQYYNRLFASGTTQREIALSISFVDAIRIASMLSQSFSSVNTSGVARQATVKRAHCFSGRLDEAQPSLLCLSRSKGPFFSPALAHLQLGEVALEEAPTILPKSVSRCHHSLLRGVAGSGVARYGILRAEGIGCD